MVPAQAPQPIPKDKPLTAATALATVRANYAEHRACVRKLDLLQLWVREQEMLSY